MNHDVPHLAILRSFKLNRLDMVPWNAARTKVEIYDCLQASLLSVVAGSTSVRSVLSPLLATLSPAPYSLAVQRLRILQQKKEAQAKSSRRDIATLIERGKLETARIKVENIINEDIHVELLELLELYCELLIARFGLLEIR
jgi:Regulator of Vps4 activity in the MVB pathway